MIATAWRVLLLASLTSLRTTKEFRLQHKVEQKRQLGVKENEKRGGMKATTAAQLLPCLCSRLQNGIGDDYVRWQQGMWNLTFGGACGLSFCSF